jgi:hypothetical protein
MTAPPRRSGSTLLEVLLATTIAVLLLFGLYEALNIQLKHAQAGRDVIVHSTVARAVIDKITDDIASSLNYASPVRFRSQQTSGGTPGAASGTNTNNTGTNNTSTNNTGTNNTGANNTGTNNTGTNTGTTDPNSGTTADSTTAAGTILNLKGSDTELTLFVARVQRELYNPMPDDTTGPVSDQRLIGYWLVGSGDNAQGLARQEVTNVTADSLTLALGSGNPDEGKQILAEEVRNLRFRYWDGTNWNDSWDGTQLSADGMTPLGPPVAIEVTLEIATGHPERRQTYRQVIPIPTANGSAVQTGTTTP